jgi:hypothetical protein
MAITGLHFEPCDPIAFATVHILNRVAWHPADQFNSRAPSIDTFLITGSGQRSHDQNTTRVIKSTNMPHGTPSPCRCPVLHSTKHMILNIIYSSLAEFWLSTSLGMQLSRDHMKPWLAGLAWLGKSQAKSRSQLKPALWPGLAWRSHGLAGLASGLKPRPAEH